MPFSCQKGEFDRFFNRLDRPVGESRPDRQSDRPVDPTGAGRPSRFPSLLQVDYQSTGWAEKPTTFKNLTTKILF